MKKKKKLFIIGLLLIIVITVLTVITIMKKNKEEKIIFESIDVSQRILINEFLQKNPYISYINSFNEGLVPNTDVVKSAIYSKDVELEYIVTEEIEQNEILSTYEGYKKSIENIKKYAKDVFDIENIQLNFVDTYYNENGYLFLSEEYIYFSEQKYPDKVYVAVGQKKQDDMLLVQIYEYIINDNVEKLENIIQTGVIDESIDISNKYIIKLKIENEKICILSKY